MPVFLLVLGAVAVALFFVTRKSEATPAALPALTPIQKPSPSGWAFRASGVVNPGEYYYADFFAPAAWTDATLATYKLSLAALGFNAEVPAGRPLPPPPTGTLDRRIVFQGRYIGPAPYDLQGTFPGNENVLITGGRPANRSGAVYVMPAA